MFPVFLAAAESVLQLGPDHQLRGRPRGVCIHLPLHQRRGEGPSLGQSLLAVCESRGGVGVVEWAGLVTNCCFVSTVQIHGGVCGSNQSGDPVETGKRL